MGRWSLVRNIVAACVTAATAACGASISTLGGRAASGDRIALGQLIDRAAYNSFGLFDCYRPPARTVEGTTNPPRACDTSTDWGAATAELVRVAPSAKDALLAKAAVRPQGSTGSSKDELRASIAVQALAAARVPITRGEVESLACRAPDQPCWFSMVWLAGAGGLSEDDIVQVVGPGLGTDAPYFIYSELAKSADALPPAAIRRLIPLIFARLDRDLDALAPPNVSERLGTAAFAFILASSAAYAAPDTKVPCRFLHLVAKRAERLKVESGAGRLARARAIDSGGVGVDWAKVDRFMEEVMSPLEAMSFLSAARVVGERTCEPLVVDFDRVVDVLTMASTHGVVIGIGGDRRAAEFVGALRRAGAKPGR